MIPKLSKSLAEEAGVRSDTQTRPQPYIGKATWATDAEIAFECQI